MDSIVFTIVWWSTHHHFKKEYSALNHHWISLATKEMAVNMFIAISGKMLWLYHVYWLDWKEGMFLFSHVFIYSWTKSYSSFDLVNRCKFCNKTNCQRCIPVYSINLIETDVYKKQSSWYKMRQTIQPSLLARFFRLLVFLPLVFLVTARISSLYRI